MYATPFIVPPLRQRIRLRLVKGLLQYHKPITIEYERVDVPILRPEVSALEKLRIEITRRRLFDLSFVPLSCTCIRMRKEQGKRTQSLFY